MWRNSGKFCFSIFNLEHKRKYTPFWYFPICCCLWWFDGLTDRPTAHYILLMMPSNMTHLFPGLYHLLTLSDNDTFIFIILIFPIHRPILFSNYFLSNWWNPPFKGGFLSIWMQRTQWSGWLYHCNVFLCHHGQ